jgi:hypothetical protein
MTSEFLNLKWFVDVGILLQNGNVGIIICNLKGSIKPRTANII